MCDFDGYVVPEIVKNRQVVVLSSKGGNSVGTTLVVPISSKRPKLPCHTTVACHLLGSGGRDFSTRPRKYQRRRAIILRSGGVVR
jgi:uncharacterized protein YifN (PemK superfamily)